MSNERELFEQWHKEKWPAFNKFTRDGTDSVYLVNAIQARWESFQAGRASTTMQVGCACAGYPNKCEGNCDATTQDDVQKDAEPSDDKLKAMRDFAMSVQLSHDYDWIDYMRDMYFIAIDKARE